MDDTLLLVDDEENVRRSLQRLFRREPYRLLSAGSGQEALELLAKEPVGVILSDQRMPNMTGSELFKIVKDKYPDTLRLIMSGYTELESITSAINDGAIFKFLTKPWDDDKLVAHIREAFDLYKLKAHNLTLTEELKLLNATLEKRVHEEREKLQMNIRSLRLAHQVLEQVPLAVMGLSDDGLIINANQQVRILLGMEAVVGCMMEDVLPAALCEIIHEVAKNNEAEQKRLTVNWGDRIGTVLVTRFSSDDDARGIIVVGSQVE